MTADDRPVLSSSDPAGTPARQYRPTRWSLPWLVIPVMVAYELAVLAADKDGGPLSHVLWWATGDVASARWVLAGGAMAGFCLWLAAHILWRAPGLAELAGAVAGAVIVLAAYSWIVR